MQLSVALYLALSAVLQILIGPISDRYGRRKVILAALIVFLLATVGTLTAPNATAFLDLPHGASGDRRRHGAVARGCPRYGLRCRGRLDDRLRHHGDVHWCR